MPTILGDDLIGLIIACMLTILLLIRIWHIGPSSILNKILPSNPVERKNLFIYAVILFGAFLAPGFTATCIGMVMTVVLVLGVLGTIYTLLTGRFSEERKKILNKGGRAGLRDWSFRLVTLFIISVTYTLICLFLVSNTRFQFLPEYFYTFQIQNYWLKVILTIVSSFLYFPLAAYLNTPVEELPIGMLESLARAAYNKGDYRKAKKLAQLSIDKGSQDTQNARILGGSLIELGYEEEGNRVIDNAILKDEEDGIMEVGTQLFTHAHEACKKENWEEAESVAN